MTPYTHKAFDEDTDILVDQREIVTAPLWSSGQGSLNSIFTSSAQTGIQKEYYYEIYNSQSNAQGSEVQFSVLYADSKGSGSSTGSLDTDLLIRPTKTNYLQYSQILLPIGIDTFTFMDGETSEQSSEYVYIINVNRSRFKDRIDTANWQLSLAAINHVGEVNPTASIITLIDDSSGTTTSLNALGGRVYNIRSGSIENGIKTGDMTPYGLFYPDNGIVVLNGRALDTYLTFGTMRTPATASGEFNHKRLFTSISGAMQRNTTTFSFKGRTSEVMSSLYYFARLRWDEFNYTNNASFFSTDTANYGQLKHPWMAPSQGTPGHPEVFPTTIGLYDDDENLLAVAKVSRAIKKTFDNEIIFKIKLDY